MIVPNTPTPGQALLLIDEHDGPSRDGQDWDDLIRDGLVRLDAPHPAITPATNDADASRTFCARVGQAVIGVASVSHRQPPGPPLRGVYHIYGVAARVTERGSGAGLSVIERCIAHAAANGGRTLWCHAPLAAVDAWRRYGFAIAGPPVAARGDSVGVPMVRRLTSADAGPQG